MTQASFIDAGNQFYLMLCDVINYNGVIFATNSLEFIKDVCFTDVQIVENASFSAPVVSHLKLGENNLRT